MRHKDKQKPCRFFVGPGGRLALLSILDVETLELLCVNCNTIAPSWKNRQFNKQRTQGKSSRSNDLKEDTADSVKFNNNIDYFLVGPDKQTDMERSTKLRKSIQQEFAHIFFQASGVSKVHLHCR